MNIAIIGCGYVGSAIAKYWQQNPNLHITVTTTTPERVPTLQSIAQKVVVTTGNDIEGLKLATQNQDVVLVCVGGRGSTGYEDTYLTTAKNLVAISQHNSTIQQIIYTSSCSVYGNHQGAWVDETTPVQPTTPNTEIIKATEDIFLASATSSLRVCILRLGGIYGPGRELMKIFSRVPGTTRPGNGSEVTNWIHLDDIVSAIDFVRQHRLNGIYNLVDDAHLPSKELLDTLFIKNNLPLASWDNSLPTNRQYLATVSNQKIKGAGYQLIHPQMIF